MSAEVTWSPGHGVVDQVSTLLADRAAVLIAGA
jgi:hypothetical protein